MLLYPQMVTYMQRKQTDIRKCSYYVWNKQIKLVIRRQRVIHVILPFRRKTKFNCSIFRFALNI